MSIQTELTRLVNAKAAIQAAIEGKGVTVPSGTLLDGMAALIEGIEAGSGIDLSGFLYNFSSAYYGSKTCVSDSIVRAEAISAPGLTSTDKAYLAMVLSEETTYSTEKKTVASCIQFCSSVEAISTSSPKSVVSFGAYSLFSTSGSYDAQVMGGIFDANGVVTQFGYYYNKYAIKVFNITNNKFYFLLQRDSGDMYYCGGKTYHYLFLFN